MATVCKLGGGGASKKKVEAAQRLENAFIFSEGVMTETEASEGSRIRTKTITCNANSESAYIVFFSITGFGSNSGGVHGVETDGTFIKTVSGTTQYDYREYDDGGRFGVAYGIVRLEPGQYIDLMTDEYGAWRAVSTHAFVMTVPKART